ncbi:MAG: patatin-like phospholipase family protein [Alphaproteobacteria bacterium]
MSNARDADFLQTPEYKAEKTLIDKERPTGMKDRPMAGLALSGGGIRSASFCLGVIEALQSKGKLDCFDYLSTSSGGGYAGSALTWLKRCKPEDKLGDKLGGFLKALRSHGNYLDPGQRLDAPSLIAVVLRAMVANLFVYGGLIAVVMYIFRDVGIYPSIGISPLLCWVVGLACLFALSSLAYALATGLSHELTRKWRYKVRLLWQMWGGRAVAVIVGLAVIGSVPILDEMLRILMGGGLSDGESELSRVAAGVVSLLTGLWAAVSKFQGGLAGNGDSKKAWYSPLVIPIAALLAVLGVLLISYRVALHLDALTAAIIFVFVMVVAVKGDVNLVSLHRMYRDRLMETFLPDCTNYDRESWQPATVANEAKLSEFTQRPYHLLNTNVVLLDSTNTRIRGRGGDSYILSPLHSGSVSTGWHPTGDIDGKGTKDGMTLATAMAISGAAVNAHVGSDSQPGILRNPAVSFLISLFGLQLGVWVSNPNKSGKTPNFLVPGVNALLGRGLRTTAWFHMLTDGGHFDNTGIYELVRRRVGLIVAVDGSADRGCIFDDLGAAIEKVRVDFGVTISFPGGAGGSLADLKANTPSQSFPGIETASRGWVVGVIQYPPINGVLPPPGRLIYIKSTLVEKLPTHVYAYAAANKDFPNQSTADQFFDEFQLESYLALGQAIGGEAAVDICTPGEA